MTLDEEFKRVQLALKTMQTIFKNQHLMSSFNHQFDDGSCVSIWQMGSHYIDIRYRVNDTTDNEIIFMHEESDFVNIRANDVWTLNYYEPNHDDLKDGNFFGYQYSILNSQLIDDDVEETERWFDSLMENSRIPTEEEYFQASLVLDTLPESYNDTVRIIDFLHNHREIAPELKNVCATVFVESFDMDILEKIHIAITEKTGVVFDDIR